MSDSFEIKYIIRKNLKQTTFNENFNMMIIDSTYFNDIKIY